jgi:Tol biopolymer transport system component
MKLVVVITAITFTVGSFISGDAFYGYINDEKKPCISNFRDLEYEFGYNLQKMLNEEENINEESGMNSQQMAYEIIYSSDNPEKNGEVHVVNVGETEFHYYVPSYCYVEEGIFGPTLWRKT